MKAKLLALALSGAVEFGILVVASAEAEVDMCWCRGFPDDP